MPCGCCSRTRCCALFIVDDDGAFLGGLMVSFFFFFRSIALLILVPGTRLLGIVSPPHQVRTAADTASEDNSCGYRRCWTAAASKGLLCLVRVVLVLVVVRFASWTMMAVICFSVDDFVLFFFRSFALLILVLVYSYSFRRRTKCARLLTPQAKTTAAGTVAAGQQRLQRACCALCVLFSYSLLCALLRGR